MHVCIWDPSSAGDAMREQLRARFTKPEMAGPGSFAGGQRWMRILGTGHGEVLAETAAGLSLASTEQLERPSEGRAMIGVTPANFGEQVLRASQPVLKGALGLCRPSAFHIGDVKE